MQRRLQQSECLLAIGYRHKARSHSKSDDVLIGTY
jgi:hypothetical protein